MAAAVTVTFWVCKYMTAWQNGQIVDNITTCTHTLLQCIGVVQNTLSCSMDVTPQPNLARRGIVVYSFAVCPVSSSIHPSKSCLCKYLETIHDSSFIYLRQINLTWNLWIVRLFRPFDLQL